MSDFCKISLQELKTAAHSIKQFPNTNCINDASAGLSMKGKEMLWKSKEKSSIYFKSLKIVCDKNI